MLITRRTLGKGMLGFCIAGAAGLTMRASVRPSAARLERELNGRLLENPRAARFTVPEYLLLPGETAVSVRLAAQVRLDWLPGFRLRRYEASATTEEAAYAILRQMAVKEFAGVVPGFDQGEAMA